MAIAVAHSRHRHLALKGLALHKVQFARGIHVIPTVVVADDIDSSQARVVIVTLEQQGGSTVIDCENNALADVSVTTARDVVIGAKHEVVGHIQLCTGAVAAVVACTGPSRVSNLELAAQRLVIQHIGAIALVTELPVSNSTPTVYLAAQIDAGSNKGRTCGVNIAFIVLRIGNLNNFLLGQAQIVVFISNDAGIQIIAHIVGKYKRVLCSIHVKRPHLVGHAVDYGSAGSSLSGATIDGHVHIAPLGHILYIDVTGLVLRGKGSVDDNIVNRQTHRLVGTSATGDTDVPCQVQVTACSKVHLKLLACDCSSVDGHYFGALGSSIGSKIGVEVLTCIVPCDTIGRYIKLYGKTGGIVTIAILLDVITEGQLGNGLIARIAQAGHHVDTACTTVNSGGQTAHRAVTGHATGSKIPSTVLGIAGQARTTCVHHNR